MSSILEDVKHFIGPSAQYEYFDPDVIMQINTAFFELNQLGVGPDKPFVIVDGSEEWDEFASNTDTEAMKTYICLKTRMYFDPPQTGTLINAIEKQLDRLEWRLNVAVDPGNEEDEQTLQPESS